MIRRARTWSAIALVVVALTDPVLADGVNTGYAGTVYATTATEVEVEARVGDIATQCSFVMESEQDNPNRVRVRYAGVAAATPRSAFNQPLFTTLRCEIYTSDALGNVEQTHAKQLGAPGATSALSDEARNWWIDEVTVCTSGYAIFGPTLPQIVEIPRKCRVPGLL